MARHGAKTLSETINFVLRRVIQSTIITFNKFATRNGQIYRTPNSVNIFDKYNLSKSNYYYPQASTKTKQGHGQNNLFIEIYLNQEMHRKLQKENAVITINNLTYHLNINQLLYNLGKVFHNSLSSTKGYLFAIFVASVMKWMWERHSVDSWYEITDGLVNTLLGCYK